MMLGEGILLVNLQGSLKPKPHHHTNHFVERRRPVEKEYLTIALLEQTDRLDKIEHLLADVVNGFQVEFNDETKKLLNETRTVHEEVKNLLTEIR